MKGNKLIKFNVLIIICVCLSIFKVSALSSFPSNFTINSEGAGLALDSNGSFQTYSSRPSQLYYPYFHIKNSNQGNVICVSGNDVDEPISGTAYSTEAWENDNQAKGVAYIINTIIGTGGSSSVSAEKYYWTQILINAYLETYSPGPNKNMTLNFINTSKTIAGTGLTYNQILENASDYAAADYSASLSADKTNLTFTKKSDGYWYSDPVIINSNTNYSLSNPSNYKFTYNNDGDEYTFKIKDSDLSLGSNETFSVTVTNVGKTYYTAQRYGTSSGYQDLTLSQTVPVTNQGNTITITGSVNGGTKVIEVIKVNSKGELIAGSKIGYQTEADKKAGKDTKVVTSSATAPIEFTGLTAGKYYIYEKEAPKGYDKSKDIFEIVISNDGTIKINGKNSTDAIVKVVNDLTQTKISKKDAVTKGELPGATLQILDSNKKTISCTILTAGKEEILKDCTWVSSDQSTEVVGLTAGDYFLKELIAPNGYVLSKEIVPFTVKGEGTINKVTMNNQINVVKISKINAANKDYLKGATLEIQDENGNVVKYCTDEKGNKNTECKWVSTDKPYEIEGMPNGKYYLVETKAPNGYVLNTKKIEFIVDGTKEIISVEMENQLEVKVPNTLSSRSALLLAIAMFDIALGIGVLTYVKKNKIQE